MSSFLDALGRGKFMSEISIRTLAPAVPLAVSDHGLKLIKSFETCRLHAYMPTPHDVPTVGWGATRCPDGSSVRLGLIWTQAQADTAFALDLARFAKQVHGHVDGVPTTWFEFDAMVSLAYNIGVGAFAESTLLRRHRDGDHGSSAAEFARWNRQAGAVLAGLTRRRAVEAAHYRGQIFAGGQ